jgi:hypothetical protein
MSLSTRIANYTNSVSGENITDALQKAVDYTVAIIGQVNPGLLPSLSEVVTVTDNTLSTGYDYYAGNKAIYVLKVERSDGVSTYKVCNPVPDTQARDAFDTASIYYALADNPVYWITENNKLFMAPLATVGTNRGFKVTIVTDHTGRIISDVNETVGQIPNNFIELIVLHASECVLMERLSDFRAKLPTDLDADTTAFDQIADIDLTITDTFPAAEYQDALDKAQNLIDGTAMGGDTEPESAQYWLADEDEDMVSSTLNVAGQELSRAQAILGEFNTTINANVSIKSQELREFQANLQKKMGLFDKIIQKLTVDYQWTQGQLQLVGSKKQEFIQTSIGGVGIKDNPSESKAI